MLAMGRRFQFNCLKMKDPARVICSMLWLCLFLAHDISVNSLLRTAQVPIQLNLRRIPASRGNLTHEALYSSSDPHRQPRSRTALFQHVLGLVPGEEFDFHLPKWKALQRCGLFFNLTARTVVVDHQVQLNISGIELPSITFAPELTLTPSLRDPELSGGVSRCNPSHLLLLLPHPHLSDSLFHLPSCYSRTRTSVVWVSKWRSSSTTRKEWTERLASCRLPCEPNGLIAPLASLPKYPCLTRLKV